MIINAQKSVIITEIAKDIERTMVHPLQRQYIIITVIRALGKKTGTPTLKNLFL